MRRHLDSCNVGGCTCIYISFYKSRIRLLRWLIPRNLVLEAQRTNHLNSTAMVSACTQVIIFCQSLHGSRRLHPIPTVWEGSSVGAKQNSPVSMHAASACLVTVLLLQFPGYAKQSKRRMTSSRDSRWKQATRSLVWETWENPMVAKGSTFCERNVWCSSLHGLVIPFLPLSHAARLFGDFPLFLF